MFLPGKGKLAALDKAMGKKPMPAKKGKKPMPKKKGGRDMGALKAFDKGDY